MFNWLKTILGGGEKRSIPGSETWLPQPSTTGLWVDDQTALCFLAVYAAIDVLSTGVSAFDLNVIRKDATGRRIDYDHPVQDLLVCTPNEDITARNYRQAMMVHCLLYGNSYSEIVRSNWDGSPRELHLLDPRKVQPQRRTNGSVYYRVESVNLAPENCLHVSGMGFDGLLGYSPIRYAREAIGLGLATEKFGAAFFGNGARMGGVLQSDGSVSEEAMANLRKQIDEVHRGVMNAHRYMVLQEGLKYEPMSIPPEEAQFLVTRRFQIEEICRLYKVPPHKLQDLERATFSNIEEQNIDFYQSSLLPWLLKIESEMNKKLFFRSERKFLTVAHDMSPVLRANMNAKADHLTKMFSIGYYSVNEMRETDGLNPIPGGDQHYRPANLVEITVAPADIEEVDPAVEGPLPSLEGPAEPETTPALDHDKESEIGSDPDSSPDVLSQAVNAPSGEAVDAVRAIVRDAYQRAIRRQANALRRSAKKDLQDALESFDEFFRGEERVVHDHLNAPIRALGALTGSQYDLETIVRGFVADSTQAVQAAVEGDGSLAERVETILSDWEATRADVETGKLA